MLDIGIDFGSTYTVVSVYDHKRGEPEIKPPTKFERGMPTVLAFDTKGNVRIGSKARSMSDDKCRKFRTFKMMLAEDDPERLSARGFNAKNSPERITALFLNKMLTELFEVTSQLDVDHLVIGAPLIWNESYETVDGRAKLRDICRSLPVLQSPSGNECRVQVVSEPEAASAYFVYNYREATGHNLNGRVLLIDYGGGTLDITLTEIHTVHGTTAEEDAIEINALYRTGAGENVERGEIGHAGIIYIETLVRNAVKKALPGVDVPYDSRFAAAVDVMEEELQKNKEDIDENFYTYGVDPNNLNEDDMDSDYIFTNRVMYDGTPIPVSYQLMAKTYDEVIRKLFDSKLREVTAYMDQKGWKWGTDAEESFRIALVGGFSNYYLVREQVDSFFKIGSQDTRKANIIRNDEERELAVSLGASLVAAGVMRIRNTAPFSIGVASRSSHSFNISYGLQYGEEIEFGKEYIQCDEKGNPVLISAINGVEQFLINLSGDPRGVQLYRAKSQFAEQIRAGMGNQYAKVFGFSLDSSGIITLHVHQYDLISMRYVGTPNPIELTSIKNLFDPTNIDPKEAKMLSDSVAHLLKTAR